MRWPWVSRLAFDQVSDEALFLRSELMAARRTLGEVLSRYADHTATIMEMKRVGFERVEYHQAPITVPEIALHPAIQNALDQLGLPSQVRHQMQAWAEGELRKDGAEPEEIAARMLAGGLA